MKSIKCSSCGLSNWSTVDSCKRCGTPLSDGHAPAGGYQPHEAYFQNHQGQAWNPPSAPQVKNERLVSFGVLLIILGGIITALSLGAFTRGLSFSLYFMILGSGILGSGIVFCLKEWSAVYVYFAGLALAAVVMFLTEENVQKPWVRLAGPTILGLFLLNKMIKSKKAAALDYSGQ
jgi:hypothetical protein